VLLQGCPPETDLLGHALLDGGLHPAPPAEGRGVGRRDGQRDLPLVQRLAESTRLLGGGRPVAVGEDERLER